MHILFDLTFPLQEIYPYVQTHKYKCSGMFPIALFLKLKTTQISTVQINYSIHPYNGILYSH